MDVKQAPVVIYTTAIILCCAPWAASEPIAVQFVDVTSQAGVGFRHTSGTSEQRYIVESMSSGAAFFDYDNDGDLDIYIVNGSKFEGFRPGEEPENALYRNNGDGTFTDVSKSAGVAHTGWGMGCAVGDYDNDGDLDLYVTNYGPNVLYRNNGDGTFTDVSRSAGVDNPKFGAGPAFADFDNDGYLDLYVANYVVFDINDPPNAGRLCDYKGMMKVYCGPKGLKAEPDVLYRNNGDGTFTDATEISGVFNTEGGYGMGVVLGDYDNDGDVDIYVANDSTPNFLYQNDGDGTFTEVGLIAGVAYNGDGRSQAGMGADMADYDNDGHLDIFVTNFSDDTNTLYHNDGDSFFRDVTFISGLGEGSLRYLGYGAGFLDYDNDGYKDVFTANGHVYPQVDEHGLGMTYRQRNQLFRNRGDGAFEEVSSSSGPGMLVEKVSRGTAFGDYDNDGDVDIFIVNTNDTPTLLRNDGGNRNNWLMVKTIGMKSNRDGVGARVKVVSGSLTQIDEVRSGSGYESQDDLRVHFGLGDRDKVDLVEVRWPSGIVDRIRDVAVNQLLTVREGQGAW